MVDLRRERGSAAAVALIVLLLLCLGGVIAYLLASINARRYRVAVVGDELVVERGRFLPVGFQPYVPEAGALRDAYAPLTIPEGTKLDRTEVFDDRADLDRALFSLLAGWARAGLKAEAPEELERATSYIERSKLLPGLSEQQRLDLRRLRADLAYRHGRAMVAQVADLLNEALAEFELSLELGTSRPTDADHWIGELKDRIAAYGLRPEAPATPAAAPDGSAAPPALAPNPDPPYEQPKKKSSTEKWRL